MRSIIIAFSTYSKIPMPRFEWKRGDMRYTMCAFPLVGAVIALIQYVFCILFMHTEAGPILTAAVLTLIPLLITGGIHMDGYMDTWDALCSYGDRDKKLEILKDPHVGAFAVIHCIGYVMLTFALWHEFITRPLEGRVKETNLCLILAGYVLSRVLSGLCAVTFTKAKKDGMLNDVLGTEQTEGKTDTGCRNILITELIVFAGAVLYYFRVQSLLLFGPSLLILLYYRHMSYKKFGGITGDLAGWFLQMTELAVLLICTCMLML